MITTNYRTSSPTERKLSPGPSHQDSVQGNGFPQFLEKLVHEKKYSKTKVFAAIQNFLDPLLCPTRKNVSNSSSLQDGFRCRLYRLIETPDMKLTADDQEKITALITMHALKTMPFPKSSLS